MEGKKILDLSNLTDEHFDSVQKAVYRCMGSGEPGDFAFATHKEVEKCMGAIQTDFSYMFCKGMLTGAAALAAGWCIGSVIETTIQHVKAKKMVKQAEEL